MSDDIYIDQDITDDPGFFAAYTPCGIGRMDKEFIDRIMNMQSAEEAVDIAADISSNPHLHQKIKDNLLFNLKNYVKMLS